MRIMDRIGRWNRLAVMTVAVLLGSLAVAGCGGSNENSQAELDRARAEGAKEARDQARVNQLQRQVNQLKRSQQRANRRSSGSGPAPAPSVGPAKTCAGGVGASSATSCDFAFNVAGEWGSNPGASTIRAYSPVTGKYYAMSCAAMDGWSAVCTGGSGAAVFIP